MSKALALNLVTQGSFDQLSIAKEFTVEYFRAPKRGYGNAVGTIFRKMKASKFQNFLDPAREQFDGMGSFGNGAAMRIAPLALFCLKSSKEDLIRMAREQAVITHTHELAVNGAILQALAVHQALLLDSSQELNSNAFLYNLEEDMKEVEEEDKSYQTQIQEIRKLINSANEPSNELVINALGHNIAALFSVPTAIYCFLRSEKPDKIPDIDTENPFRKCLEYSIGLGGDTDTIASMACSISGAYRGDATISENLLKHCEESEMLTQIAEDLFKCVEGTKIN